MQLKPVNTVTHYSLELNREELNMLYDEIAGIINISLAPIPNLQTLHMNIYKVFHG